ncbi:MAG: hypothetical protein H6624_06255 [Bdellovibrionaceae bacterium]|nr:hypothetical protein [Bdellovibrionales bacterium]MCB9083926.1 hypothetical protein [Pseudobdellovibrionaceae bacterium]
MVNGLLCLFSVVLFCVSARFLMKSISMAIALPGGHQVFSRRARRVERAYKILAWSCLTLFLFVSMLQSFWQTFSQPY